MSRKAAQVEIGVGSQKPGAIRKEEERRSQKQGARSPEPEEVFLQIGDAPEYSSGWRQSFCYRRIIVGLRNLADLDRLLFTLNI
ncbi:hypothetical protein [Microcoleus vaginatus]|uniref:hypothetical protein n=1 Tax=Microcoleus vaginatus TaxID=119532 RepID=UPI001F60EA8D|nr:hypothetical protein D0A37_22660 [Microcoleus vaginatus HSN003]